MLLKQHTGDIKFNAVVERNKREREWVLQQIMKWLMTEKTR